MAHTLVRAAAALTVLVAGVNAGSPFPASAYTRAAGLVNQMTTTEKLAMVSGYVRRLQLLGCCVMAKRGGLWAASR
jgi:hypothetical protein